MRVKNVRKTKKKLHDVIEKFIAYKRVQVCKSHSAYSPIGLLKAPSRKTKI